MSNVTKLTSDNYLMCSIQTQTLLVGYSLYGHIDGFLPSPPRQVAIDGVASENPEYTLWSRHNRLIFSALIGAITITLQPLVSRASTSDQIWQTLANTYAKPSSWNIKQLKDRVKFGRRMTKPLISTFKASQHVLINLSFLVSHLIMKTQSMLYLEVSLKNTNYSNTRLKEETYLHRS